MSKQLGDIDYTKEEYLNLGANFEETLQESIKANTEIILIENKTEEENSEEETEELEEQIQNIELEAKFVAKKIKEILNSKQVVFDKNQGYRTITYKDMVILLRSTKDKANIFENELIKLQIPVYSDTSTEYLNSIEIQTIMNLLKVIDNPTVDIPLVSILRSMIGGFSDNELIKIRLEESKKSFYEAMKEYKNEDDIKNKIDTFLERIKSWKMESEYLELDELMKTKDMKAYLDNLAKEYKVQSCNTYTAPTEKGDDKGLSVNFFE
jgi:ATP-dependent helicase/nuclease subunit A